MDRSRKFTTPTSASPPYLRNVPPTTKIVFESPQHCYQQQETDRINNMTTPTCDIFDVKKMFNCGGGGSLADISEDSNDYHHRYHGHHNLQHHQAYLNTTSQAGRGHGNISKHSTSTSMKTQPGGAHAAADTTRGQRQPLQQFKSQVHRINSEQLLSQLNYNMDGLYVFH
mmetsp:Transcript_35609/g.39658  ORF Transcript_35609/g.39658 Transcript_35609/m.39658 type:complete len:170 (-) Transcript_35609:201-710(-)